MINVPAAQAHRAQAPAGYVPEAAEIVEQMQPGVVGAPGEPVLQSPGYGPFDERSPAGISGAELADTTVQKTLSGGSVDLNLGRHFPTITGNTDNPPAETEPR